MKKKYSDRQLLEFSRRLRESMDKSGLTATDLANITNIDKGAISNYVNAKYLPKQDKIYLLAGVLGVSPSWLYALDTVMVPMENTGYIASGPLRLEIDKSDLPKNVIAISDLSAHRVPLIGSAAAGEPVFDEEYNTYVDGPMKADCAIRVKGMSMEPTYINGDLLYIRAQPDVDHDGQVAVVICGDEACVKHVYRHPEGLLLTSNNPQYSPMLKKASDFDGALRILGKVIGFTRMFE